MRQEQVPPLKITIPQAPLVSATGRKAWDPPALSMRPPQMPNQSPSKQRIPSIDALCLNLPTKMERQEDMAARLALLLHARECCQGPTASCKVKNCDVARGVLDHCLECAVAHGQCHTACTQAKTLLRHFRLCRARNTFAQCKICRLLKRQHAWALKHTKSLAPLQLRPLTPPGTQSTTKHAFGPTPLRRIVSDPTHDRRRPAFPPSPLAVKRPRLS